MAKVLFNIDDELLEQFRAYCKEKRTNVSNEIRQMILDKLKENKK